jgi:hypothetical protein
MPGFIDVSGMTSEEVRRLGHADDYDEETNQHQARAYSTYRNTAKIKKPLFSYDADKVWGAAVVAYRTNGGYVKALAPAHPAVPTRQTNRQIVEVLLSTNSIIPEADIEEGSKIRQYFKGLTFKVIEGKTLTPFLTQAMNLASNEFITDNLGVGTIASLPATYEKMTERDSVANRIKWARGGFIGQVGDNTTQTIEIIKEMWSSNYNCMYYTGITDNDQVLFFSHKGNLMVNSRVTIEGKVKSHRDNSTQLSHVKVIK